MSFDQKHIEDYVFGRLGDEERAAFQFALMRDKNLRQEVEAMRVLQKMARAKKSKRRSLLFFSPRRMLRVAAVFIGLATLAVLIALYNNREKELPVVNDEKTNPIEQKEDFKELQNREENVVETPQEEPTPKENIPTPKNNQRKSPKIKPLPEKEEGIANSPKDTLILMEPKLDIREDIAQVPTPIPSEEDITFLEEFQYGHFVGMQMFDFNINQTEYKGQPFSFSTGPEFYYISHLPKYPKGIYFDFVSSYPVGEKSKRAEVGESLTGIPHLDSIYKSQNTSNPTTKLIGKNMEKKSVGISCRCGTLNNDHENTIIKFYNNNISDFQNNEFILDIPCYEQRGVNISFPDLDLGLYYIVFENKETEEILAVEKFEIVTEDKQLSGNYDADKEWMSLKIGPPEPVQPKHLIPNPILEKYIGKIFPENTDSIRLQNEPFYTCRTEDVAITFSLLARKQTKSKIRFLIYTNEEEKFTDNEPIVNSLIFLENHNSLSNEKNNLEIVNTIWANFRLGLYYMVVTSEDEKYILAVSKFEVKAKE